MNSNAPTFPLKTITSALFASSFIFAVLDVQAAVSQSPLSLTVGVPPNMIFTLDDSGSMVRGYAPDKMGGYNDRRAKAGVFNPMYYSPSATYSAPKIVDNLGVEKQLSTSFSTAYVNGFHPTRGSRNLTNGYQVTINHDPDGNISGSYFDGNLENLASTGNQLAENPAADFRCTGTGLTAGSPTKTCSIAGGQVTATITRTDDTNCTATISGWNNGACTLNSGNWTASWVQKGVPAYYYTYNAGNAGCTAGDLSDEDCYSVNFVGTDEQQNFANWYSFYRTRALATLSAASLAFFDLSPAVRLTWQALNKCTALNVNTTACKNNRLSPYTTEHKSQFYTWLTNAPFGSGTPLPAAMRRAGNFLSDTTAWELNPNGTGNTTANTYACRPSYHVMMTDGQWNENVTNPSSFRHDNATFTLPDGKPYIKEAPFVDATSRTLADLAMHYWATDLNTSLADKLAPYVPFKNSDSTAQYWDPRNDPATWQHMVNFIMGLGLTNSLQRANIQWQGSTFASDASGNGYKSFADGTAWPAASTDIDNNNGANVYDLWHAAINSRGEFFSVDSPETMVQAFADILSRIAARKSVAAKPAINSGQVIEDETDGTTVTTVSYQTSYSSEDNWAGDLTRSDKERKFNAATGTYVDSFSQKWSANDKMPAPAARNIRIKGSGTSGLQAFTWSNAGDAATVGTLANLLSRDPEKGSAADGLGEARLNYLRGERTGEGTTFRTRSSVLGDLYSSSPAVVSRARYLTNFANRLEGGTAYTTFAASMANRKPMVYVGGNDGMLHGFNAATGVEEFAFIPSAVFDKLNKYTGKNYSHEFYVDGSPVVADVYDGTSWRTILVGTLRAGGKSVFALDITTPGSEKLLWEFDDSKLTGTDAVKMGYSFSKPTVARLANPSATQRGPWAVIFGNGYESANHTNGKAALFILDALTGDLLTADNKGLEVTGTNGVANGLSTPKLSDYNADGIAEFAYAGDLQGNLWRFDLNPSKFAVAYGDKPLFSAVSSDPSKKRQPITAAPSLVAHPSGIGYLVIIGTGKYFETSDKDGDKSIAQTLYGIWDAKTKPTDTTSAISITRSNLVTQSIVTQEAAVDSQNQSSAARTISDNEIAWFVSDATGASSINKYGWALDLKVGSTLDGEMVIEDMATLGRTLFFQSLVPNDDPCGDGASNWTYAINPATGGKTSHHAFDLRLTAAGKGDQIISGRKQDGEGGITVSQKPDGSLELCTGKLCIPVFPDPASTGRQTWRPIEEQ